MVDDQEIPVPDSFIPPPPHFNSDTALNALESLLYSSGRCPAKRETRSYAPHLEFRFIFRILKLNLPLPDLQSYQYRAIICLDRSPLRCTRTHQTLLFLSAHFRSSVSLPSSHRSDCERFLSSSKLVDRLAQLNAPSHLSRPSNLV